MLQRYITAFSLTLAVFSTIAALHFHAEKRQLQAAYVRLSEDVSFGIAGRRGCVTPTQADAILDMVQTTQYVNRTCLAVQKGLERWVYESRIGDFSQKKQEIIRTLQPSSAQEAMYEAAYSTTSLGGPNAR